MCWNAPRTILRHSRSSNAPLYALRRFSSASWVSFFLSAADVVVPIVEPILTVDVGCRHFRDIQQRSGVAVGFI